MKEKAVANCYQYNKISTLKNEQVAVWTICRKKSFIRFDGVHLFI